MKKNLSFLLLVLFTLPVTAQQWSYDHLSGPKIEMITVSSGSKIYFYSGITTVGSTQVLVDNVEIIDINTQAKTVTPIASTVARTYGSGVALGGKVLFAGGLGSLGETTRVDIYDTLTNAWSNAVLSAKRYYLAGTSTDSKAFFGGGYGNGTYSGVVDIYNLSNNTWSATQFPNATQPPQRTNLTAAAIGDKVFFAGGLTVGYRNLVSVYNASSSSWMTNANLSQYKGNLSNVIYKNKIYFIGGKGRSSDSDVGIIYPSDTIDIYDHTTDSWGILKIPRIMYDKNKKRPYTKCALAGCKIFLVPAQSARGTTDPNPALDAFPDTIAIYDVARNTWSYEALPHPRSAVTVVAAKNKVYFAGGSNIAYPENRLDDIDIYTLLPKLQLAVGAAPVEDYSYDFGDVLTTNVVQAQLNMSNEGDYNLLFTNTPNHLTVTGDAADFTVDLSALQAIDTLEPAQIITIPASFHPTSAGEKSITLQVTSNDPYLPVYSFVLKGNGTITNSNEAGTHIQAISIYPVPCSDLLNIQIHVAFQQAALRLTDLNGKVIYTLDDIKTSTQLPTASIPNGIYFLQIKTTDNSYLQKVIVTH